MYDIQLPMNWSVSKFRRKKMTTIWLEYLSLMFVSSKYGR